MDQLEQLASFGAEFLKRFGQELGAMEGPIIVMARVLGILVVGWGVLQLTKLGKRGEATTPTGVAAKLLSGTALVLITEFVRTSAISLFGEKALIVHESLGMTYIDRAAQYTANPLKLMTFTCMGFFVIVGWVFAIRALVAWSRLGDHGVVGYDQFKIGATRLLAAVFLTMFQYVMMDLDSLFTGGTYSSVLAD